MTTPKPDPEGFRRAISRSLERLGIPQDTPVAWGEPDMRSSFESFREIQREIDEHIRATIARRQEYLEDLCRQMVEDGNRGILLFDYQKPAIEGSLTEGDFTYRTEWVLQGQLSDLVPYGQIYEVRSDPETSIADRGLERLVDEAEQRRHDARPVPASWHVPASGVLPETWKHYCPGRAAYTRFTYEVSGCDSCPAKAPLRRS